MQKTPGIHSGPVVSHKQVKNEESNDNYLESIVSELASIEIVKCISFQKFRYFGEDRPGEKFRDKDFITLKLNNLKDKVVRVQIMCTDADNPELIHPNGLKGVNCKEGIYDKLYSVTKQSLRIDIPYIRIERMKTRKDTNNRIPSILKERALCLISPYKERCLSQCLKLETGPQHRYDTTKVCLGVFVTVENDVENLNGTLHAVSQVIRNGSEKTELTIARLSNNYVSAMTGGRIDIFTSEKGPDIEPDSYFVYVSCVSKEFDITWESKKYPVKQNDILYKKVIAYNAPHLEPMPYLPSKLEANLHLVCPESKLQCTFTFYYVPDKDTTCEFDDTKAKKLKTDVDGDAQSTEGMRTNLQMEMKTQTYAQQNVEIMQTDANDDLPENEADKSVGGNPIYDSYYIPQNERDMYIRNADSGNSSNCMIIGCDDVISVDDAVDDDQFTVSRGNTFQAMNSGGYIFGLNSQKGNPEGNITSLSSMIPDNGNVTAIASAASNEDIRPKSVTADEIAININQRNMDSTNKVKSILINGVPMEIPFILTMADLNKSNLPQLDQVVLRANNTEEISAFAGPSNMTSTGCQVLRYYDSAQSLLENIADVTKDSTNVSPWQV